MAKKQYYFIRYVKSGRTYFKNQDGKRVSRAKVEKDRKKVYVEIGRSIGDTFKKGELISLKDYKSEIKSQEAPKIPEVSTFNVINVNLQKEISQAISAEKNIFIQKDGETYKLKSKKSLAALQLFVAQVNSAFYNTIGKKTDSPLFNISIQEA
jgi:hypothetical protein